MRVFISHSSINADAAQELCKKLENSGFSCFIAPRDIRSGYEYAEELVNGIDSSDMLVLLLSQEANNSPHVLREIERAVSKGKPIIVYKLEEVTLTKSLEYFLMTHQWVNAKPGRDFDEIVTHVTDYANRHPITADGQQGANWQPDTLPVPSKANKTKRSTAMSVLVIVAAAVLLVAAGVLVPFVLSKSPDNQPNVTDSVESSDRASQSDGSSSDNDIPTTTSTSSTESTASTSESTVESSTAESKPLVENPTVAKTSLGAKITLGTYNNEPIVWRVIHISEDGTRAVALADSIITMKAFDAAEGGTFNKLDSADYWKTKTADLDPETQRAVRGDNRWERSNIRVWLNSARANVKYEDQAPTSTAMSEKRNGYHTEAGFLSAFTEEELSAIAVTSVVTDGTVTEDKVFLLSEEELKWLDEADVSLYTKPTAAAVEQDKSNWYKVNVSAYNTEDFIWWLRTPNPDNACECKCVNLSYFEPKLPIKSDFVGLEGFGIRPAVTLDLTSAKMNSLLEN